MSFPESSSPPVADSPSTALSPRALPLDEDVVDAGVVTAEALC